jgi:hypothetical protein
MERPRPAGLSNFFVGSNPIPLSVTRSVREPDGLGQVHAPEEGRPELMTDLPKRLNDLTDLGNDPAQNVGIQRLGIVCHCAEPLEA